MSKNNDSLVRQNLLIDNASGSISQKLIEPWADEIAIGPGDKINVLGFGPTKNARLDIEYKNSLLVVYAWSGSIVTIQVNGEIIETVSKEIKAL